MPHLDEIVELATDGEYVRYSLETATTKSRRAKIRRLSNVTGSEALILMLSSSERFNWRTSSYQDTHKNLQIEAD